MQGNDKWLNLANKGLTEESLGARLALIAPEQAAQVDAVFLRGNLLRALPEQLRRFTSLTGLYLTDNRLESLPPWIGELRMLVTLWAENNRLRSLPWQLRQMPSLADLHLRGNEALPAQAQRDLGGVTGEPYTHEQVRSWLLALPMSCFTRPMRWSPSRAPHFPSECNRVAMQLLLLRLRCWSAFPRELVHMIIALALPTHSCPPDKEHEDEGSSPPETLPADEALAHLLEMGFSEEQSLRALRASRGRLEDAVTSLLFQ